MKTIRKISAVSLLCLTLFTVVTVSCTEENEPPTTQEIQNNSHQTAKTQFITVKGNAIAYRVLGKEDGVPLVLLPGLGGSMDDWDPEVTDGLAKKYKVIIFDNKGVASSNGTTPNTVQAMADEGPAGPLAAARRSALSLPGGREQGPLQEMPQGRQQQIEQR